MRLDGRSMMHWKVLIVYIIEDNGCYGRTKGQFSATAGGAKSGIDKKLPPCGLAVQMGPAFVARSFFATSSSSRP